MGLFIKKFAMALQSCITSLTKLDPITRLLEFKYNSPGVSEYSFPNLPCPGLKRNRGRMSTQNQNSFSASITRHFSGRLHEHIVVALWYAFTSTDLPFRWWRNYIFNWWRASWASWPSENLPHVSSVPQDNENFGSSSYVGSICSQSKISAIPIHACQHQLIPFSSVKSVQKLTIFLEKLAQGICGKARLIPHRLCCIHENWHAKPLQCS